MKTGTVYPGIRRSAALLSVAFALGGCASSYHFAQVVGTRYWKTNIDTYPVSINSIDGRDYIGTAPILMDPGLRTIVVQGPPTFVDLKETQTIQLDAKPCVKYYLVAVKPAPLLNEFAVRIDYEEPIAGCTPPPK